MAPIDTATLNNELRAAQARSTARENPHSKLSLDEKKALLGMIVTESDQALARNPPVAAAPAGPPAFAPAVDWRNRNGNHVTPVTDQMRCGSCVCFCCAAVVESMASIELGQLLDLSEADSHFNSSHGPTAGVGTPTRASTRSSSEAW
jgi:C1A family cysteine protease